MLILLSFAYIFNISGIFILISQKFYNNFITNAV